MADFDEGTIIIQLQKRLKDQYQQIGDAMIGGGVDNMEKYKYMLGQAHAYQYITGEISNLLNKGAKDEQGKSTILSFGNTRNKNNNT
jgi:hypothetical protein|tara:strand:- start:357 stop:617 length:261 start_codon:yes stop_codon:yes gene_type:complete